MNIPFPAWRKYAALLILLTTAVTYSCRKDNNNTDQLNANLSDAQLIANAKAYFDSSMVTNSSSNKQATDYRTPVERLEKTINWEEAYTYVAHIGKMVMLPVRFKKQLYAQAGQQKLLLDNITRLFVYTGKSGKKHIEVVTRIPDEAYLNNPAKDKPFSGIVKVNDWQGNFIKAYRFTTGKVIRLGAPEYMPVSKSNKAENAYRKNDIFCYSVPYYEYNYSGDYTYWVTSGYDTYCYGSSGGGYDQDQEFDEHDYGQGGETGDGDTTQPPPTDPCVEKEKVKVKAQNAIIASQNNALLQKAIVGEPYEYGTEHNLTSWTNGSYMNLPIRTNSQTNTYTSRFTWDSVNGYTVGFTHYHPQGTAFSPSDVYTMVKSLQHPDLTGDALMFYKSNVTMTVVTANGNYMMTITDWAAIETFGNQFATNPSSFNQIYIDKTQEFLGSTEAALLSMFGNAINLYKAETNSINFKPLVLNSSNQSTVKLCP